MFVFTVKSKKIKLFLLFFISIIAIIIGVSIFRSQHHSEEGIPEKYSTCAKTNEDRVNFLSQFGWQVNCEPLEMQKVTVPETFNAVYEKYNEIQKHDYRSEQPAPYQKLFSPKCSHSPA